MPGPFEGSSTEQTAKLLADVYDAANHLLRTTGVGGAGGAVSVADGADIAEGAIGDVAVVTDAPGTVSAKLRGLIKILADVWDDPNNALKVNVVASTGGGLTNAELRAAPVPVTGPLTDAQLRAAALAISAVALPLPAGASTEATLAAAKAVLDLIKAKTDNLDTALSTRASDAGLAAILAELGQKTEPADQQHTVVDSSALPAGAATQVTLAAILAAIATEATLALIRAKTDNLDVALSTRTKPSDQQHAIVDSSALPTGAATQATLAALLAAAATEATLALIRAKTDNLDVALSTRTKPSDQQHVIVDTIPEVEVKNDAGNPVPISATALDVALSTRAAEATLATRASEATLATRSSEATLAAVLAALASVAVTGPLTDAQLRAAAVAVSAAQGTPQADLSKAWPMTLTHGSAPFRTFDMEFNRMRRSAEADGGELRRAKLTRRTWLHGASDSAGKGSRRSTSRFEDA